MLREKPPISLVACCLLIVFTFGFWFCRAFVFWLLVVGSYVHFEVRSLLSSSPSPAVCSLARIYKNAARRSSSPRTQRTPTPPARKHRAHISAHIAGTSASASASWLRSWLLWIAAAGLSVSAASRGIVACRWVVPSVCLCVSPLSLSQSCTRVVGDACV